MTDYRKFLCEDIIARNIHGQHIFMSKSNSDVFTLNETASFIFQCLDGATSMDEVAQKVIAEFKEDDPEVVKADIQDLIQTLLDRKILKTDAAARLLPGQ